MTERWNLHGYIHGGTRTPTASAASYTSEPELTGVHSQRMKRWRVGGAVGRAIYVQEGGEPSEQDTLIGLMDTKSQAMLAVLAVNSLIERQDSSKLDQDLEDDKGYIEYLENRLREMDRRIGTLLASERAARAEQEMLRWELGEKRALALRLRAELDRIRPLPRSHSHHEERPEGHGEWRMSHGSEAERMYRNRITDEEKE